MNWIVRCFLVSVVLAQVWSSVFPIQAQVPEDLGTSVDKLTATVEGVATLLEKELALSSEDRDTRRVEAAVAILGLRYRKIDQLERELQRISREEEELSDHMALMRVDVERLDRQGRAESGQLSDETTDAIAEMELRIRFEEDRMVKLREQELVLQNDLTAEQRRLSHVEATLDTWLEKLE